jgi:hypothetical protein
MSVRELQPAKLQATASTAASKVEFIKNRKTGFRAVQLRYRQS